MPSHLPTTSPVAVAAARILAAYLSNHRLSPAEAASLGGTIVESLAALTRDAAMLSEPSLALAEEPAPRRQTKARADREAPADEEPPAPTAEPDAEPDAEPEPNTEPAAEREDGPPPPPEPIAAAQPDAAAEATNAEAAPRRRKRPSRPRSRRGKGLASEPSPSEAASDGSSPSEAASDAAASDAAPNGEPPAIEFLAAPAEIAVTPGDAGGAAAAEDTEITKKPRRGTSRARRVKTA